MTTGMQKNHVFQLKNVKRGGSWGGGKGKRLRNSQPFGFIRRSNPILRTLFANSALYKASRFRNKFFQISTEWNLDL